MALTTKKIQLRVIEFWEDSIKAVDRSYNDELKKKIAQNNISLLSMFKNNIDEKITEVLVLTMQICESGYNGYAIIQYLLRIVANQKDYKNQINYVIKVLSKLNVAYWSDDLEKLFKIIKCIDEEDFMRVKTEFAFNNPFFGTKVIDI